MSMFSTAISAVDVRPGNRRFERIEVDHHQVDRLDRVLRHHRIVSAAAAENAAMNLRVERFDPAIHHFRETRVLRDFATRQAGFLQRSMGVSRRQDFHTVLDERLREIDDAGFVGNAQQRPPDRTLVVSVMISLLPVSRAE